MTYLKEEVFLESNIIDPNWIIRYLLNHLNHGRVSSKQVMRVLKKMLTHIHGVSIKFRKTPSVQLCFCVAGVFDTETKDSIQIEIFNESYEKKFNLEEKYYYQFIFDLADTLCHESIHRYQHSVRLDDFFDGYSSEEHENYYRDPDELFAYSVNIAHSLYRKHGSDLIDHLHDYKQLMDNDPYFGDYCNIFNECKILKKLLKMIYQNVIAIENGNVCHRPRLNA